MTKCKPIACNDVTCRIIHPLYAIFLLLHSDTVDPAKDCYWITADYYQSAVEFIGSTVELSTQTSQSLTTIHSEDDLMSEYSASYGQ